MDNLERETENNQTSLLFLCHFQYPSQYIRLFVLRTSNTYLGLNHHHRMTFTGITISILYTHTHTIFNLMLAVQTNTAPSHISKPLTLFISFCAHSFRFQCRLGASYQYESNQTRLSPIITVIAC